jgi:error-prone DNA polymerase
MLSGLPKSAAEKIVRCRRQKPFASYEDFALRTGFHTAILSRLAQADAFQSLERNRRPALWSGLARNEPSLLFDPVDEEPPVDLPELSPREEVFADYQAAGLSLRAHPFRFLREELQARGIVAAAELATLEPDRRVHVAGLVLLRQRPGTAKGITFMTLEDETGTANLIVHRPTWDKFHRVAGSAGALLARGLLQRQDGIIHVVVDKLEDLTGAVYDLRNRARDFR